MSDLQRNFIYRCKTGDVEGLRRALAEGALLDTPDFLGHTALARACAEGQLACVLALLEAGADPNLAESGTSIATESCPPLVAAAAKGGVELVRALLAAGARLDARSSRYRSALSAAAEHDAVDVMRLLLEAGAPIDQRVGFEERSALGAAAYLKRDAAISCLLEAGADVRLCSGKGKTALHEYCASVMGSSSLAIARALLEAGAPVDARDQRGRTALHGAARWNRGELVGLLLDAGADPNTLDDEGASALHGACLARDGARSIPLLLAAGARVDLRNTKGELPLHLACATSELGREQVRALLEAGADVHALDNSGRCALARAFGGVYGQGSSISGKARALLDAGARCPGAVLERGARYGDVLLLRLLLAAGAPLDHRGHGGRTALHWAAYDGLSGAVETLLGAGMDVDGVDDEGNTALHFAARELRLEVVVTLLKAGAKVLANQRARTPLYYLETKLGRDDPARAQLLAEHAELAEVLAGEAGETREGLRCPARGGATQACVACAWVPSGERALCCPWCGKQGVEISDYEVLQGNPEIPTPNTEVRFGYTCRHCALEFSNGWNAMNTERPHLFEPASGASWRSEDGGRSWARSWGIRE